MKEKNILENIDNPTELQLKIVDAIKGHTAGDCIHAFEVLKLAILQDTK